MFCYLLHVNTPGIIAISHNNGRPWSNRASTFVRCTPYIVAGAKFKLCDCAQCFVSTQILCLSILHISSGVWPIWPQRSALYTGCPWTTAVNCINSCTTKSARRSMLLHVHEPGGAYKDIGSFMSWLSFIESNWTIKKVLSRRLLHPPSNPSNPPRHRRTRSQERTIKDVVAPHPPHSPKTPQPSTAP